FYNVVVVFEFEGTSYPLLDELESLKDYPPVLIMSTLTLKDDQVPWTMRCCYPMPFLPSIRLLRGGGYVSLKTPV
nr:hypothetical protein [Tanacetum cinerariifolium]